MVKLLYKVPRFLLSTIVIAVVLYLTLFPRPFGSVHIPLFAGADKVVHGVMFLGVAFSLAIDFSRGSRRVSIISLGVASVALASFLGGAIEMAQWQMGMGRSGDWFDFAADFIGAVIGVAIAAAMLKRN